MTTTKPRNEFGQFTPEDVKKRSEKVQKELGYKIKEPNDYTDAMNEQLEKYNLKPKQEKVDEFGFSEDFYRFLGLNIRRKDFYHDFPSGSLIPRSLQGDTKNFYTPIEDFYGTPSGNDMVYNYGRVPVSHLLVLASQRLGIVYRGCHGVASDVFMNRFSFVKFDNPDKVVERPEIMRWMKDTFFWDHMVRSLDYERRSGLGYILAHYPNEKIDRINTKAPLTRPNKFESFSCFYLTPVNILESLNNSIDYDKNSWDFLGGVSRAQFIHRSRVYPVETRPVEGGLRGIAIAELCWVPLMCYLNTMYYVLKSLSRMGTLMASINTEREVPTSTEVQRYIDLWNTMYANKIFVLGKNAKLNVDNVAGKLGSGIDSYLEFLREDISSAWIIPKNQLFGRAEGGGLEGAGALISKEDYLASNISCIQMQLVNDVMYMLTKMYGFKNLEDVTLRWNIDMHKTEEQRLREQMMRQQVEQMELNTKNMKKTQKLNNIQIELQKKMAEVQMKMLESKPEKLLEYSKKDEENLEEKKQPNEQQKITGDLLKFQDEYNNLKWQYEQNQLRIDCLLKINYNIDLDIFKKPNINYIGKK